MPSIFTLSGSDKPSSKRGGLGQDERCICKKNPRTKKGTLICFIGKGARTPSGKKSRSGWLIKGSCPNPR